jgi:hypothetical protein
MATMATAIMSSINVKPAARREPEPQRIGDRIVIETSP